MHRYTADEGIASRSTQRHERHTSEGVNVKYRINSSRLISGNDRNCSYCSRENIFSDNAGHRHRAGTNQAERSGSDLLPGGGSRLIAGQRHIRRILGCGYGDPDTAT
jgi:hypothetical protein